MPQDTNKLLQEAYKTIDRMVTQTRQSKQLSEETRKDVLVAVSKDILSVLQPLLGEIAEKSKINAKEITKAVSEATIKVNVEANTPEVNVNVPDVIVPDIKIPPINYTPPAIKFPDIKFPDTQSIEGWVRLQGVDLQNPLPVQLRDSKGAPVNLLENLTTLIGGGGGGFRHVIVDKMPDITVSGGLTDAELRAAHLDVQQVSGSIDSVKITGTDSALDVIQVSGSSWSVNVAGFTASVAAIPTNGEGVAYNSDNPLPVTFSAASVQPVSQVSGHNWSVSVTDSTATGVTILNGDGAYRDSFPVTGTFFQSTQPVSVADTLGVNQVSGASFSVNVVNPVNQGDEATALRVVVAGNSDASVVVNSGTITTVTTVTGITNSVAVVGNVASDVADNADPPVKIGGIARTANPTAVAAGDRVSSTHDDLGRQLIRPLQVRDLIQTAYVSVTNGTETTLRAAVAGAYLDLIMIVASNNSDAAVSVDIRPVTAGNVINTLRIPANGTAGWTPPVPFPQSDTGNNWTVDGPDETGRTMTFTALFSQEI